MQTMLNSPRSFEFQSLEPRRLLTGVTLLIHGHQGNITGWIASVSDSIREKLGNDNVSQYVLKVGLDSKKHLAVKSFTLTGGPSITASSTGEELVAVDWTDVDDGSQSTTDVGKVVADYMLSSHTKGVPAMASLPIHLIGHSRGASMVVAISEDLGKAGVQVDQDTFLDPHPVGSYFGFGYGDHDMDVYSNVTFADDYWRDNGQGDFSIDPNGQSVDGTHQGDLNKTVGKYYIVSAHSGVPAYYEGTVDMKAVSDNDEPILASKWYGNSTAMPARNKTGYYFSRIVGGARPADGLSPDYGGTAKRKDVDASGSQWANVTNMKVAGGKTFAVGSRISVHYSLQDRDSTSSVQLFLDSDTNPFNNNTGPKMRQVTLPEEDNVTATATTGATDGATAGTYYIYAKITDDAGHYRYAYTGAISLTDSTGTQSYRPPAVPAATSTSKYTSVASSIFSDKTV